MRVSPFLSTCAILLSLHSFALAGDFYVDPVKGKDVPTAGSAAQPWKSINYAIAQSNKLSTTAHTYHLAKGSYTESPSSASIPVANSATMSFVGVSPKSTNITGTFTWGPHNGIQLRSLSCAGLTNSTSVSPPAVVEIQDCTIGNCTLNASRQGSYKITIQGSRFQKLDVGLGSFTNSRLLVQRSAIGQGGAQIRGTTKAAGSLLEFEDCRFENATQDGLTATLARSSLTIRRCLFRGAGRFGLDLRSSYGTKNGNVVSVADTTILLSGTAGIHVAHDPRGNKHREYDQLQVASSVLSENGTGIDNTDWAMTVKDSMLTRGRSHAIRCKSTLPDLAVQVIRSSIADNKGDALTLTGFDAASIRLGNCILSNNAEGVSGTLAAASKGIEIESCTIADSAGSGYAVTGLKASALRIHHTIFGGNKASLGFPAGAFVQYCLSDRQVLTGTGNRKAQPGFVNQAQGMYQLSPTSPAIDAGLASLIRASKDYEGDPRIQKSKTTNPTPDIGADEFSLLGIPHLAGAATVPMGMPALRFSVMNRLRTGSTFSATLVGPRSNDATLWLIGLSERRLVPTIDLPLDMGILGFPGTLIHTSLFATFAGARTTNGDATITLPVPDDKTIRGLPLRFQALVLGAEGLAASPLLRGVIGKVQTIQESFSNQTQLDATLSGATWGSGQILPGKLGGSGIHGRFRADSGQFLGLVNGIKRYLWNTDLIRIPFGLTLHGEAFWKKKLGANKTHLIITTGKLEFSEFVLAADEALIFRGQNLPEISCIGDMKIDGQIFLEVANGKSASTGGKGAPGGAASLGGAAGGRGGDIPSVSGATIRGSNGAAVVLPKGHPRSAAAKGTAGQGSPANPANGSNKSILYFGTSGFASRMTAAGGAGGSLWSPNGKSFLGLPGTALSLAPATGPTFPPHNVGDIGAPSVAGKAFAVLPITATMPSRILFRIGGSGGGGGGTCPCGSFPSSISWLAGAGGGAGGGVIHIMTGHKLFAGSKSRILARGGIGAKRSDSSVVAGSGGGGSGGSVLLQSALAPAIAGEVNVMGGAGGIGRETTWLEISSRGGQGGAGMIRVESVPAPGITAYTGFQPPVTAQNTGLLRPFDYSLVTVATSKWYHTGSSTIPAYLDYTLVTKVNGKTVTFSDDGKHQRAQQGQAVVFLIQSAKVDPKTGQPIGAPSDWHEGTVQALNGDKNNGTSFRFMIRLDLSVAGITNAQVQSLTVRF